MKACYRHSLASVVHAEFSVCVFFYLLVSCALGIKRAPATWDFFMVTTSIFLSILEETKGVSFILQMVRSLK